MFTFDGLSTQLTLKLLEKTKPRQIEAIETSAMHSRAIETFREKVGDVESIDDLLNDYDSYSFLMKAFDLEDKIYAKGMMRKIFESDRDDKTSLLNRLNDPKLKALHEALDFQAGGITNYNTFSSMWQQEMVDKYVEQEFVNQQGDANASVGVVLKARSALPDVKTWFGILADEDLGEFMRTALQISEQVILTDLDKQVELFEKKYDLEKLKDPAEVEKLVQRYSIFKDLTDPNAGAVNSPILTLMGFGGYSNATYDIEAIGNFSASAYR